MNGKFIDNDEKYSIDRNTDDADWADSHEKILGNNLQPFAPQYATFEFTL